MNIQLPTGMTINVSVYEYLFLLQEDDIDLFYQQCIADNIGTYIDNPFSNKSSTYIQFDDEEDDIS